MYVLKHAVLGFVVYCFIKICFFSEKGFLIYSLFHAKLADWIIATETQLVVFKFDSFIPGLKRSCQIFLMFFNLFFDAHCYHKKVQMTARV
jgi:hypothetical protein